MVSTTPFAGIDYGSKLAGTTAVAMLQEDRLQVWQSVRGQDADLWLLQLLQEIKPAIAFIDAPLSLPKVYSTPTAAAEDYFYRACDREVKAMSPMFIGGLTARAIRLRATLQQETGITTLVETYPSQLVRLCWPEEKEYKKGSGPTEQQQAWLLQQLDVALPKPLQNWHQFDAALAWYSGKRFYAGKAQVYGTAAEGEIVV